MSLAKPPIVAAQSARFIAMPSAMSLAAELGSAPAQVREMPSASARRWPSARQRIVGGRDRERFRVLLEARVSAGPPEPNPDSASSVLFRLGSASEAHPVP
jgi:hypothetical protein